MSDIELAPYFIRIKKAMIENNLDDHRQLTRSELEDLKNYYLSRKEFITWSNLNVEEWKKHVELIYSFNDLMKNQTMYMYYLKVFSTYGYNDPKDVLFDEKYIKEKEWTVLIERSRSYYYKNGILTSKQYTVEELLEKRKYFESLIIQHDRITQDRWLMEIKRCFERAKSLKKYPDSVFCRLEAVYKYGF